MGAVNSGGGINDDADGEVDGMVTPGSGVSGALSSLWSTSSDKDDTCVQWGLVRWFIILQSCCKR